MYASVLYVTALEFSKFYDMQLKLRYFPISIRKLNPCQMHIAQQENLLNCIAWILTTLAQYSNCPDSVH